MIFILSGAGISDESGIQTFRSDTRRWEEHGVEDVATPECFRKNPGLVHRLYDACFAAVAAADSSTAHVALARLQVGCSDVTIVTQNVDDLHGRVDSTGVLHMHGALTSTICQRCGARTAANGKIGTSPPCPALRLAVPPRHHLAWRDPEAHGSNGHIGRRYSAADFARVARNRKARCIEISLQSTETSRMFIEHRRGPASATVSAHVEEIPASSGR